METNLKNLREDRKWSVRKLGMISGVSSGYISELERGIKNDMSIEVLCKLCKALKVTPNEFIPSEYYK